MTTLNLIVSASARDARQSGGGGTMSLTALQIELAFSSSWMGLGFTGVTIPQGQTLDAAVLSIFLYDLSKDDSDDDIYVEDVDDSAVFTTTANNISDRTRNATPVNWAVTGLGTGYVAAPSVLSLVQIPINRAGWVSGNALSIIFDHLSTAILTPRTYDNSPSEAATLDIDYTPVTSNPWYAYAQQ